MPRQLKRFQPKGSKYVRKTQDKHGQEIVKPLLKKGLRRNAENMPKPAGIKPEGV